ncbi:10482_t:CDS:2 [Ambispora leptoticha]|uniref:10482_t:CDS:1 n=1 Tax=Ambispora leptoticha TaxID=144679 RepID=A0A9N9F8W3_9GLOM|nr:10482_t:CDS:2 [Ambispora leptoticha]
MELQETKLQQQLEPDLIHKQEQTTGIIYSHKRKIFQDPETLELQIFDENDGGEPPKKYVALDDYNDVTENKIDNLKKKIGEHKQKHQGPIACHLPPHCRRHPTEFPSITAFEIHYNSHHRFICDECQAVFPTKSWLDMHLTEFHDVLAQIRKEKGQKIHKCYVQGCERFFSTPKMRRLHLIDKHQYPTTFDFGMVKEKNKKDNVQNPNASNSSGESMIAVSTSMPASAPDKIHTTSHNKNEDVDKDVEMLAESLSKLTIPMTIKFGRDQVRTRLSFGQSPSSSAKFDKKKQRKFVSKDKSKQKEKANEEENHEIGNTVGNCVEKQDNNEMVMEGVEVEKQM